MRAVRFACLLAIAVVLAPAWSAPYSPPASVPRTGIGFRGDGTGFYPNSKPPTEWDETTGKNILWKAPLPNWSYSSPVPVGNRVFVMSEPGWKTIFPQLNCFDADTGQLLWQREVDPFLAFTELAPGQHQALVADLAWVQELYRTAYRLTAPLAALGGCAVDAPECQQANEELAKHGMYVKGVRMNYGQLRALSFTGETDARYRDIQKRFRPYGVSTETTWYRFGEARVGACFPSPVSDGERVYVMTFHGTVACYDMDGNLQWIRWSGYSLPRNTGLLCSPRLYGDLLLTGFMDQYNRLFAWDKRTGEQRWVVNVPRASVPRERDGRPYNSLEIMSVGNTDVVLTATGNVVRLPDGKAYATNIGPTSVNTWALDDEHDTIFFMTGGDANPGMRIGMHLAIEGDDLNITERYALKGWNDFASPVFAGGRLFHSRAQLDPQTGAILGQPEDQQNAINRNGTPTAPRTKHLLLAANGYVYGCFDEEQKGPDGTKASRGVCEVFSYEGAKIATNILSVPPLTPEKREQWMVQGFPNSFSYGCPMNIGGDRLYICSKDYLYCIAETAMPTRAN